MDALLSVAASQLHSVPVFGPEREGILSYSAVR